MSFLERYPEATLQDIYKGSFQDYFGPAHALSNRESVRRYILSEMEQVASEAEPTLEPCGWRTNYYRVDLAWVKSGAIDIDTLVDAFMASAKNIDVMLLESWQREWNVIEAVVRSVAPTLPNLDNDSAAIAEMLDRGEYVVHHSDRFNAAYHPHYRIISQDFATKIFNEELALSYF